MGWRVVVFHFRDGYPPRLSTRIRVKRTGMTAAWHAHPDVRDRRRCFEKTSKHFEGGTHQEKERLVWIDLMCSGYLLETGLLSGQRTKQRGLVS